MNRVRRNLLPRTSTVAVLLVNPWDVIRLKCRNPPESRIQNSESRIEYPGLRFSADVLYSLISYLSYRNLSSLALLPPPVHNPLVSIRCTDFDSSVPFLLRKSNHNESSKWLQFPQKVCKRKLKMALLKPVT